MALRQVSRSKEEKIALRARFGLAQDTLPDKLLLRAQADIRFDTHALAQHIDETVADSREKSLAITHLEEALMWAGKAIFKDDAPRIEEPTLPGFGSRNEGEKL